MVATWPHVREVVLDAETTGLSPRVGHRIISLSLVEVFDTQSIGARCDFTLDPCRSIPADATAIHGIRDSDVRCKGLPRFRDVSDKIVEFIGDSRIVGYNVRFDLDFLAAEFSMFDAVPTTIEKPSLDVMAIFEHATGRRCRLYIACEELGIDISKFKAHSARDDAEATASLYIALRSCYTERWDDLARGAGISICDADEPTRQYQDDDLQESWNLFQGKQYEPALARALMVVQKDQILQCSPPNTRAYELTAMIFRRQARLLEERNLLLEYFNRALGRIASAEEIIALAVPPWETAEGRNLCVTVGEHVIAQTTLDQRPEPQLWAMADRFSRVSERLGKPSVPNTERLEHALASLPKETAFTEAAVCLRKMIMERKRSGEGYSNELLHLHRLAQQHAFLYGTIHLGWNEPENRIDANNLLYPPTVATLATEADLEAVVQTYHEVGYLHLPLLNKTDVRCLVAALGEPSKHVVPRQTNMAIWERYRRESHRLYVAKPNIPLI